MMAGSGDTVPVSDSFNDDEVVVMNWRYENGNTGLTFMRDRRG